MPGITTVIFDFDSTLAESLPEVKKIFLALAQELHYTATPQLIDRLIHKEIREVLKEIKLPLRKLPKLERLFRTKMKKVIKDIKPFPEFKKILPQLKKEGYRLGIFTSNAKENVEWFLKKYQFAKYFNFIDGGSGFFGKARRLKKLLKKENLKREEVIYIGDETRDIQAAKKNKVKVIAVTWGINPKPVLNKYRPDFIIDKPQDLLKILEKI